MEFLDLLFPKHCVQCKKFGDYLCADCFAGLSFDVPSICLACNKAAVFGVTHPLCRKRMTIDGTLSSLVYKGVVKRLIYQFKYKPYLTDLQKLLSDLFYEGMIQQEQLHHILQRDSILVPIPLHMSKWRQRGYNHAALLTTAFGKKMDLDVIQVLKRVKKTTIQSSLNREERLANMRGAFVVDEKSFKNLKDKQVLLVDDIITSGATMMEASRVLKKAGLKYVWGMALAHGM